MIHQLFRFAALRHPEHTALILAIPPARFDKTAVSDLGPEEAMALLAAPDRADRVPDLEGSAEPVGSLAKRRYSSDITPRVTPSYRSAATRATGSWQSSPRSRPSSAIIKTRPPRGISA